MYRITATALDRNDNRVDATCVESLGDLFRARFNDAGEAKAAMADLDATLADEWHAERFPGFETAVEAS
jgi:hypothetical protein